MKRHDKLKQKSDAELVVYKELENLIGQTLIIIFHNLHYQCALNNSI